MSAPAPPLPQPPPPPPPAPGPWRSAWDRARARPAVRAAMLWIALVAVVGVLAPLIASGHPLVARDISTAGVPGPRTFPLLARLTPLDIGLLVFAAAWLIVWPLTRAMRRPALRGLRLPVTLGAALVAFAVASLGPPPPPAVFDAREGIASGTLDATFTLVPFSPFQRPGDRNAAYLAPGSRTSDAPDAPRHLLGTDALGQDVLAQLIHGCRLALSVGLVAAGVATLIGVTLGAIMGLLAGWTDAILSRLLDVVAAVPLLYVLLIGAAVLPRDTHVLMILIGLFTWTGAARFVRAEFLRLRTADHVLAAHATGVPRRSIVLTHMLPGAVAPVIVDASFAVAAAIVLESTLSYLGLGPAEQASWGRLLSAATGGPRDFSWWLAVYPGAMLFLTALSCNVIGQALRDAMNPRA